MLISQKGAEELCESLHLCGARWDGPGNGFSCGRCWRPMRTKLEHRVCSFTLKARPKGVGTILRELLPGGCSSCKFEDLNKLGIEWCENNVDRIECQIEADVSAETKGQVVREAIRRAKAADLL